MSKYSPNRSPIFMRVRVKSVITGRITEWTAWGIVINEAGVMQALRRTLCRVRRQLPAHPDCDVRTLYHGKLYVVGEKL